MQWCAPGAVLGVHVSAVRYQLLRGGAGRSVTAPEPPESVARRVPLRWRGDRARRSSRRSAAQCTGPASRRQPATRLRMSTDEPSPRGRRNARRASERMPTSVSGMLRYSTTSSTLGCAKRVVGVVRQALCFPAARCAPSPGRRRVQRQADRVHQTATRRQPACFGTGVGFGLRPLTPTSAARVAASPCISPPSSSCRPRAGDLLAPLCIPLPFLSARGC